MTTPYYENMKKQKRDFPCHAKFRDIINSEGGLDIPHLMFLSWPLGKQQPLHKTFPIKVQRISIFLALCYLKLVYKKRMNRKNKKE